MISKKFLGIFGILVLIFILIPLISAPCTCGSPPSCGVSSDNCGQCYSPSFSSCLPGSPICYSSCSCVVDNTEACSFSCSGQVDHCPEPTTKYIYSIYDTSRTLYGMCSGGSCNFLGQNCISYQGFCNASNECGTPEYCGGGNLKCVYSQSKLASPYYGWTSVSTNNEDPGGVSVLDCSDGHDNDCDGLIDCQEPACASQPNCQTTPPSIPKLIFRQGGVGGPNAAVIGSNGVMDIRLTNFSNQGTITPTSDDFVVKNGANVVAMISNSGNLYLKGTIYPNQATLSSYLTNGQSDFIVKNSTGSVVAVIDLLGNLRLVKSLRTNKVP